MYLSIKRKYDMNPYFLTCYSDFFITKTCRPMLLADVHFLKISNEADAISHQFKLGYMQILSMMVLLTYL